MKFDPDGKEKKTCFQNKDDNDSLQRRVDLSPRLELVPLVGHEVGPPHGYG